MDLYFYKQFRIKYAGYVIFCINIEFWNHTHFSEKCGKRYKNWKILLVDPVGDRV